MPSVLGTRLKRARKAAGLTQKELEKISGVKQNIISKIELGVEQSVYTLRLARALKVDPEWLAGETPDVVKENEAPYTIERARAQSLIDSASPDQLVKIVKILETMMD